jgi:sterol desaturase/sphingolipid hydroxylase (fatty acid hydroxylase superfamily)
MSKSAEVSENPKPGAQNPEYGYRTPRGDWRPPYPLKFAPLFVWPLQLRAAFKWAFGYPGFIWPVNVVYWTIAAVSWLYFQPPLEQCATLQAGWILKMLLRNLVLMWLIYGGWHLLLYTFKVEGTNRKYDPRWLRKNDRNFLFRNQLYDNIFWSVVSGVPIWTAYEVLYMWGAANHYFPTVSWREHPVYCTLMLIALPFWREFHFYWIHRAIHIKPLYKYVHYLHHKNVNPGPWSGMAMHPAEHLVYFTVILINLVVPLHPIHLLYNTQKSALEPASTHHGFEGPILDGKLPTGSYFHYLHHRYFECNYGGDKWPFDKVFGTFRDGLSDALNPKVRQPGIEKQEAAG